MKCQCDECRGEGKITCPECGGQGTYEGTIEKITLISNMRNYEELKELQKDASRVIRQAARLKELNPARSDSYDAQLEATLFVINGQAEIAAKKSKPNHL
jgi:DnaJ-class molecular chaperone